MMGTVRAALFLVGLAACSFAHGDLGPGGAAGGDAGGGDAGGGSGTGPDASTCAWSYTPTNFDPCELPAPAALAVTSNGVIDTDTTMLPKKTYAQGDGTTITVLHLSSFRVEGFRTLTVTGTGVVFAVDGEVDIDGTIVVAAGSNVAIQCDVGTGVNGTDSQSGGSGGGGGGGAAAGQNGGNGGAGEGSNAGAGGNRGTATASTMTPLRGGCRGGNGGRRNESGAAPQGGRGGGAIQISSNDNITIRGMIDAAGRGGAGAPSQQVGAGGGGSGGAIFLEGPSIDLNFASRVCADGGSGGEGGGATVGGNDGRNGECTGLGGASTSNTTGSVGGDGGGGGWIGAPAGGGGASAQSGGAGGGGGGGGVGWIRIKSPDYNNHGSAVTPAAVTN